MSAHDKQRRSPAFATRVAQRLTGPAATILGYQQMIVDEICRRGPAEAQEDACKVLTAAQQLAELVGALGAGALDAGDRPEGNVARLRHDLRTPVNAVLGYSELVLEDFAERLPASVAGDIQNVIVDCGVFLKELDRLLGDRAAEDDPAGAIDASIAERLERILAQPARENEVEAGHILVIDDTRANRDLLSRQLARRGHTVEAVASAREGLERLAKVSFDVLLVDILMPDMNGIELLGQLKADDRWRGIPVVMISGLKETKTVARCIAAGAEDYLQRPIDPVLLHTRVGACLDRVRWHRREQRFLERIAFERDRADTLLHSVLPASVIRRLNAGETRIADRIGAASIVFADIVDFTQMVLRTDPQRLVGQLATIFSAFDELADKHGIEKIKTIGDAYMAAAGLPDPSPEHAQQALAFSRDMLGVMKTEAGLGLSIRVGLHTGPVMAGLIGRQRFVYDVWGETVNLASRLESTGQAGRIHVSEAFHRAVGGDCAAAEAQVIEMKGLGEVRTLLLD